MVQIIIICIYEAARYLVFELLRRTETGLLEFTDNNSIIQNKHILAYVSGLGFGTSSGIFILTNVLADMVGPATYGLNIDESQIFPKNNFFLISSALTLAIVLLNTFWNIILFDGCKHSNYKKIVYVIFTHFFVSLISLLNQQGYHVITLTAVYLSTIVTGTITYKTVGGSLQNFTKFITCK
ncbi:APH1A family protein [Megaselia abdita]